tara:strand:+ start:581 stop:1453 length:873 start_codon:yes stop_codon:yes gene_type:complete
VAKIITMPSSPNFTSSEFSLFRTIGTTVSPFTGKQRNQEFDGVFWQGNFSLPPMRRSQAVQWQSFLLNCKGPINNFHFADPDALVNMGTFNGTFLKGEQRINNDDVTLSFSGSTVTANASTFGAARVGDFIHITGATNEENNGTHKITTVTSNTVVVTDSTLTTESNTASCKVKQNVKGAEALSLRATTNVATGTIKQGDYLGLLGSSTNNAVDPIQLVYVTEDATETNQSGDKNDFSVAIQPKLRTNFAGNFVRFANPKGLFRLAGNEVNWKADKISNYGISFSVVEVI